MENSIGIFAGCLRRVPFAERLALIRAAGFDATCLWWDIEHPEADHWRDAAPRMVRDAGLALDNLHAPYRRCNWLWTDDAEKRAHVVRLHAECLRDCARYSAPKLVMHLSAGTRAHVDQDAGLDSMMSLAEIAQREGLVIALENTRRDDLIDAVLNAAPANCVGLCYDNAHDHLYNDEPHALLDRWGHRVALAHLSDNDGILDRHWSPGEGVLNFAPVFVRLQRAGYRGTLMLEAIPKNAEETPESFLDRARQLRGMGILPMRANSQAPHPGQTPRPATANGFEIAYNRAVDLGGRSMAKKKALIIDDETIIRQVVAGALEADGWETIEAADGKDAADVASKESPDLIVMDMLMPGKDGLTAFKELRVGDATAHIPIVMLSGINDMDAGSNRDAESIGMEAGVAPPEAFLNKPASGDEIRQAAREATRQA